LFYTPRLAIYFLLEPITRWPVLKLAGRFIIWNFGFWILGFGFENFGFGILEFFALEFFTKADTYYSCLNPQILSI